jgi:hypothetical protein
LDDCFISPVNGYVWGAFTKSNTARVAFDVSSTALALQGQIRQPTIRIHIPHMLRCFNMVQLTTLPLVPICFSIPFILGCLFVYFPLTLVASLVRTGADSSSDAAVALTPRTVKQVLPSTPASSCPLAGCEIGPCLQTSSSLRATLLTSP